MTDSAVCHRNSGIEKQTIWIIYLCNENEIIFFMALESDFLNKKCDIVIYVLNKELEKVYRQIVSLIQKLY